jgi:hypothetical protein
MQLAFPARFAEWHDSTTDDHHSRFDGPCSWKTIANRVLNAPIMHAPSRPDRLTRLIRVSGGEDRGEEAQKRRRRIGIGTNSATAGLARLARIDDDRAAFKLRSFAIGNDQELRARSAQFTRLAAQVQFAAQPACHRSGRLFDCGGDFPVGEAEH